jgi:CubicO group peptidase (beta-lactamase class C family)
LSTDLELWGRRASRIAAARAEAGAVGLQRDLAVIDAAGRLALVYSEAEAAQRRAALADEVLTLTLADARAALALVEEGRVALDDPVATVIPEFADLRVFESGGGAVPWVTRAAPPMRMIDLLRHTSGLTYGFLNRSNVDAAYRAQRILAPGGDRDADAVVAALAELPLEFAPGSAWNYSVSTDVLGIVVARLEGAPLDAVFRRRILAPLKMDDTFFHCPPDKVHRLTDAWMMTPAGARVIDRAVDGRATREPVFKMGGGGLLSTIADYHRFCSMMLAGGTLDGARVIGRKTIDLMTRNHLPGGADIAALARAPIADAGSGGTGFGLGFERLVMICTGLENIRDSIPFPRYPGHCNF